MIDFVTEYEPGVFANGFKNLTDVQGGFGAISKLEKASPEIVSEVVSA